MSLLYEGELSSQVVDSGIKFPTSIRQYHAAARLRAFLAKSPLFDSDKEEWRDIPKFPQQGLDAIVVLFGAIFAEFSWTGLTRPRDLVRSHRTETVTITRSDNSTYSLRAEPAIIITGIGPNFPPEQLRISHGNLFCVFPLELQVEDDWDDVKLQVQAFVYARYVASLSLQPTLISCAF